MVAGAQVTAFRRALLRRIRSTPLSVTIASGNRDAALPISGLRARQFAILASNDGQESRQNALQLLTDASKVSWRLRAVVKDVGQSLPSDRGRRFYNRRLTEALEQNDLNRAWAIVEMLHRRHPDKAVLWPYTYNLLLRHYCKQQKTLMNANLTRILALLDVMVAQGCADQTSFQVAMAACSRARHLRSARHILEKMESSERQPDAKIYGFLINCCARKQGLVTTAEQYFGEMLSAGVKPTILVVNSMLRVYSRDSGRSKVMLELLKRARDEFGLAPNTVTTRMMLYYLLCEGKVESAVKYMRGVESDFPLEKSIKLPVKRQVMNSLIDASRQRGDWNSAEYALSIANRADEEEVVASGADRDVQDTIKLEEMVAKRDAFSPAIVWALDEQDWSRMTRSHQEAFFLNRSQKESFERALERMRICVTTSKADRSIQRLSLKLDGKLRVLDEMIRSRKASDTDFNAVLGACGRQGQLTDAFMVFSKMKTYAESSPECTPTTWSYNALLNACAVRGDVRQIESIVNEMVENAYYPDQVTVNTVIKAHVTSLKGDASGSSQARLNTVMQALSFYEWCTEDQKLDSGAATHYSLFRLFSTYLETPAENSSSSFENTAIGIDNDIDEQDEDFIEGQEGELMAWMTEFITTTCRDAPLASLDTGVFNNAFDYYHKLGDVDESFALFNLMKKRGFQPDDTTLGLMFATCATQQQFEVGLNFLDHLMAADGYKPTLKVLSGAMQLCANSKNPDGALDLFRAIETSGAFTPTVETYEPVVFAYARVGNVTSAWEIASEMEDKLGRVSVSIYNRILLACVEAALPGRALEVLGVIRHKGGVTPDIISYNTTLEAFVKAGERAAWWRKNNINWEGDDADYDDDDEVRINQDTYNDEGEEESDDLRENVAVSNQSHTTTEDPPVEATQSQDFELEQREKAAWVRSSIIQLLDEMLRSRVKPDMTTYERAIAACSVNEDSEGVIMIFDRLIGRKLGKDTVELKSVLVSESSFSAYLEACTSLKDKARVVEAPTLLHKWHTATGQVPPVFVVTQLLDSMNGMGEWRRAVRMLPSWQALFGIPPSVAVFNRVMQMCNSAGEHQLVAPIFATMQDATAYRVYPDAESYIQRIYAEEQQEKWVAATDLFVEMQNICPGEEISHHQLQKIALGRYSLRQNEH